MRYTIIYRKIIRHCTTNKNPATKKLVKLFIIEVSPCEYISLICNKAGKESIVCKLSRL